ncbi:FAD-dependent oxidoreductase [Legionella sp. CNM-4043-24]|uniref:FAD-dependent oxidoreductase n=1 Tax=Legionella sp. CNM-4043-24 TaxID=3421646 RepID=UPI00403B2F4F
MPGHVLAGDYPDKKLVIVGGGIIGYLEAYYAFLDARQRGERLRVTIHEKNARLHDTTVSHLVPSLSSLEILAVVPKGSKLIDCLQHKFTERDGLRVDDVSGANDSVESLAFLQAVLADSHDETKYGLRKKTLMALGEKSMALWQAFYDQADSELQAILRAANFQPSHERSGIDEKKLHDGYRFHFWFNTENALDKAREFQESFEQLGYQDCKILSPDEVMAIDPVFQDFCRMHSSTSEEGVRVWNSDASVLWRPGGCIDTQVFLPLFHDYLQALMGQYVNEEGVIKNAFSVHFQHKVEKAICGIGNRIHGLQFFGIPVVKTDKHAYHQTDFVFCPGESVGTLRRLGFMEPPYARFAGASLVLNFPVPPEKRAQYEHLNEYMSAVRDGVSSVWQTRLIGDRIFMGIAGTKAYYGVEEPSVEQEFARNRALIQLDMLNTILPELISLALGRDTKGVAMSETDLNILEEQQLATRWVGSRAVAYDGFPTIGPLYNEEGKIQNGRCTTHLGSGGSSFSHASILASRQSDLIDPKLVADVLDFGDTRRGPAPG